ncbi:MAG: glutamate synthase subunit beta, partial [Isosphaeraceae bacterium]
MADPRGFLNIEQQKATPRPVHQRIKDFNELYQPMPVESVRAQASRCMDCGVPFCHSGCPLGNLIPDWNELVHRNRWQEALVALHDTNNFPEFTGKTCPAPCEASCVLALSSAAVTIKDIEAAIVDRGWEMGWIVARPPARETGKSVAIVGSGPAGLAAAQQLRRAGHTVTVYERDDRAGGLLAYGIPDFKMAKVYVERRIDQLEGEGVRFILNAEIGRTIDPHELRARHDAILLTIGATVSRDLEIPGKHLRGIELAMPFLTQQNRRNLGTLNGETPILATGKNV